MYIYVHICISTPNPKAGVAGPLPHALRSPLDAPTPLCLSLSLYIYKYTHIYTYIFVYIYVYIFFIL